MHARRGRSDVEPSSQAAPGGLEKCFLPFSIERPHPSDVASEVSGGDEFRDRGLFEEGGMSIEHPLHRCESLDEA